ncbi:MAG TPA: hypothetical protein VK616_04600 [Flavitalea sp.]|nr:hypothetical protein [Flavitalea sp.]
MAVTDLDTMIERSNNIRKIYHQLEKKHHGSEWSVSEDALAFLTDAGLVGRYVMAQQGRWPKGANTNDELQHKLGECIWWLTILADRMDIDIKVALETFLTKTEDLLK